MKLRDWEKTFHIKDEVAIREYASRLGDKNPLHHDAVQARKLQKVDGIILPGVALLGIITSCIAEEIPGVMIRELKEMRFPSPVYAPAWLVLTFSVTAQKMRRVEAHIRAINGVEIAMEADCLLWLPKTVQTESIAA